MLYMFSINRIKLMVHTSDDSYLGTEEHARGQSVWICLWIREEGNDTKLWRTPSLQHGWIRTPKLFPPSDIDLLQGVSDLLLRPTYLLPLFHPAIFFTKLFHPAIFLFSSLRKYMRIIFIWEWWDKRGNVNRKCQQHGSALYLSHCS